MVAASEWGAARALTMAQAVLYEWVPLKRITGWHHSGDAWHMSDGWSLVDGTPPEGVPRFLPPVSALRPAASVRQLGRRRFDRLLGRVLWSGGAGRKRLELLTLVGEYPVGLLVSTRPWPARLLGGRPRKNE